jgi:N-acyl-D-amino-acid deacylase
VSVANRYDTDWTIEPQIQWDALLMSRESRLFGRIAGACLIAVLAACSEAPQYDVIIQSGSVVDGTGSPVFVADIAIVDNKIAKIGDLGDATAERVIDASGLIVSPGFVDLHNHADRNIRDHPGIENYLHQGVTTILAGNCGNSPVDFIEYMASIVDTKISLNLGLLIGHNDVREEVMGNDDRRPTVEEQVRMEGLVQSAMDAGAFGMSTGLIYLPGTYSETDEVVALARVVAKEGGIYASHIRNEFDEIFDAIEEAINVGRAAGLPVHISHFKVADNTMWGDSTLTLGMVESAREAGLDVTIDQYPYTAGSTGLANVLPKWARAGSKEDFQARLDNPEVRAQIKAETIDILNGARAAGDLSRITVASFDSNTAYVGKTMAEVTTMNGLEPTVENGAEVAMNILYDGSGGAIYHMMVEEDVRRIMLAPFTSIASDGSAVTFGEDVPHLRNYGTFPRVLRKYVREDGILSLEQAIHKMTAQPASRIGLKSRGVLAEGMAADINIFDAGTVMDRDEWAKPHQYATGFSYVFVNGVPVIEKGERTREFPGEMLRRQIEQKVALNSPDE